MHMARHMGETPLFFFDTTSTNQLDFQETMVIKGRAGHWPAILYIPVAANLQTSRTLLAN